MGTFKGIKKKWNKSKIIIFIIYLLILFSTAQYWLTISCSSVFTHSHIKQNNIFSKFILFYAWNNIVSSCGCAPSLFKNWEMDFLSLILQMCLGQRWTKSNVEFSKTLDSSEILPPLSYGSLSRTYSYLVEHVKCLNINHNTNVPFYLIFILLHISGHKKAKDTY